MKANFFVKLNPIENEIAITRFENCYYILFSEIMYETK